MAGYSSSSGLSAGSGDAQRNQRYVYLVGRLNNRQMTMEEATELFGIMQGMLRQSEAARLAMLRATPPPPPVGEKPRAPPPPAMASAGDDFFLMGLLAMGAGAGFLAAMSKRIQDATPPSPAARPAKSSSGPPPA